MNNPYFVTNLECINDPVGITVRLVVIVEGRQATVSVGVSNSARVEPRKLYENMMSANSMKLLFVPLQVGLFTHGAGPRRKLGRFPS